TLQPGHDHPGGLLNRDCQVLKPTKTAHLWLYHDRYPGPKLPTVGSALQGLEAVVDPLGLFTGGVSTVPPEDAHVFTSQVKLPPGAGGAAHLEGITRGIKPGDPVLFAKTGGVGTPGGTGPSSIPWSLGAMIAALFGSRPPAAAATALQQRTLFTKVTGYD